MSEHYKNQGLKRSLLILYFCTEQNKMFSISESAIEINSKILLYVGQKELRGMPIVHDFNQCILDKLAFSNFDSLGRLLNYEVKFQLNSNIFSSEHEELA